MFDLSKWGVPRNSVLIESALTHRSYLNEHPHATDNERLEFLGDAILDFVVAEYLYRRYPGLSEGELTSLRAALIKGETLARFAQMLGLDRSLRLSRGEELAQARSRVPVLAGAFEAVVGAIYLERGIGTVRRFVLHFCTPETEHIRALRLDRDAKSVLQEYVQGTQHLTPRYQVVEAHGPDHAKRFVVAVYVGEREWGRGVGSSRHRAEIAAAQNALDKRVDHS